MNTHWFDWIVGEFLYDVLRENVYLRGINFFIE
jgi:hypothetical protein